MNDFTARKIGEVLAFARVGQETLEKGRVAFSEVFDEATVNAILEVTRVQASQLTELAGETNVIEAVLKKAETTTAKLRAMRELYLKEDDWDDSAELLEWSGFFFGAAVVHWALVQGAAEKLEWEELKKVAGAARAMYESFLDQATEAIRRLAEEKAAD